MKILDTVTVVAALGFLIVGSIVSMMRRARGKGHVFGEISALPESWRGWVLGEKRKPKT